MPNRRYPVQSVLVFALTIAWIGAVAAGMVNLWDYGSRPGKSSEPPTQWPADCPVKRNSQRPTLLVFAHPRCPCTRATIGELAILMAQCLGQVDAEVFFFKPADAPIDWVRTDLWESADAIPGVTVVCDDRGVEANRFASVTSGHALLYDADGALQFSGGITASRGHAGSNAGRRAIAALLAGTTPTTHRTNVFGCSLVDAGTE